jgi:hypothetical protein
VRWIGCDDVEREIETREERSDEEHRGNGSAMQCVSLTLCCEHHNSPCLLRNMENVLSTWPALAGVFQNFVRSDLEEVELTVRAPLSQSHQPPPIKTIFAAIIRKFDLPVSSLQGVQPLPVHPTSRSCTWTFRLTVPTAKSDSSFPAPIHRNRELGQSQIIFTDPSSVEGHVPSIGPAGFCP